MTYPVPLSTGDFDGARRRLTRVRTWRVSLCDALVMAELAGRIYVPKLYRLDGDRSLVVDFIARAVEASGGRVVYNSFADHRVAPIYMGAEDGAGRRYGMLMYPFTTTKRATRNRPADEHRAQIRFGDPVRARDEANVIARDVAGVDVTLVLAVDPENEFIVGLDPLVYEDLPMGISVYYRDQNVAAADEHGWAVWERTKAGGTRRQSWAGLETLVGFRSHRLLDYVRFEAKATGLGLDPGLRAVLAESFIDQSADPHDLERLFGVDAKTILDIVEGNFRLGIAVRGGVAEHHLERALTADPTILAVTPIDADGQPDFLVKIADGRELLIECKTASPKRYANGDFKVEAQKTRDSGAGRKYGYDQFDVLATCLFSATGMWEFRFRRSAQLTPWVEDATRIAAIQRVDQTWARSLGDCLSQPFSTGSR